MNTFIALLKEKDTTSDVFRNMPFNKYSIKFGQLNILASRLYANWKHTDVLPYCDLPESYCWQTDRLICMANLRKTMFIGRNLKTWALNHH